jgi:hypothetical protein
VEKVRLFKMSHLPLQDQLIAKLVEVMTSRRSSPSYSTGYYWNERVLIIAKELLGTTNASFSTLLRHIIKNAEWFGAHYNKQLSHLQRLQAQQSAISVRKDIARIFERDRGARLDIGAMVEKQAERQENDLRAEAARRLAARMLGSGTPLGSHPVVQAHGRAEQPRQELQFRLTPPDDLVLRLEVEYDIAEKLRDGRGVTIEGVDEDMIKAFWALYPANEGGEKGA